MKTFIYSIYFSILIILFLTGVSLAILHVNDFLYVFTISYLELETVVGVSESFMVEHYHAVMNFLNPFSTVSFSLPELTYSENGATHFVECRILFRAVYLLSASSLLLLILGMRALWNPKILRCTAFSTICLPCILGMWFALDFNQAFTIFHSLFFANDYWIFDPYLDPIILILPQDFFLYCGIWIAGSWFVGALVLLTCSIFLKRKDD
ncbi:MAG: TIGR01906 family membrane protein [Eubacteriales bacterium]